jgi:sugar/nucleoside kinase (ribokinase family)
MAASFFSPVRLLGVIGSDCPFDLSEVFAGRAVDLEGLEVREGSKTFRWAGTYHEDINERTTDKLELNVLAEEPPKLPDSFKDSKFVFLANTAPALQNQLLEQIEAPAFVAADTMDCWIEGHRRDLESLLKKIDCLIINDEEARLLASEFNLIKSAEKVLDMGPSVVIIKKGESGSLMCSAGARFILPAFPAAEVKDPTGAGDSFAGGLMGYIAKIGKFDFASLEQAIAYGTVAASFTIADFSVQGLATIKKDDIESRFKTLRKLTSF